MKIRQAPFALRVVRRHKGDAGILYRRTVNENTRSGSRELGPSARWRLRPACRSCALR